MGRRSRERSGHRSHKPSANHTEAYQSVPHNNQVHNDSTRAKKRNSNRLEMPQKCSRVADPIPKSEVRRPQSKPPRRPPNSKPRKRSPKKERVRRNSDDEAKEIAKYKLISKVVRAILARILFITHSILTTWRTVQVYDQGIFWAFSFISLAIIVEGAVVILSRAGNERKWFCWSVFLYIAATVPPIWMLELHLSQQRYLAWSKNMSHNNTANQVLLKLEHTVYLDNEIWVQLLEQFLLVILIVGRWLLPKGEITREQLSQILLAYLAIASDIVELFDVFKERAIAFHAGLRYFLLGAWSLSLLQFPFVITTSRARKMRIALTTTTSDEDMKRIQNRISMRESGITATFEGILHDLDIWAIILANGLQDIPFLIMRLTLMFGYDVFTYTMIFFTCKNALILALQGYRMGILINDRYITPTPHEDVKKLTKHYREMLSYCRGALNKLKESDPEAFAEIAPKSKRKSKQYPNDDDDTGGATTTSGRRMSKSRSRDTHRTSQSFDNLITTDDANTSTLESKRKRADKSPPRRKKGDWDGSPIVSRGTSPTHHTTNGQEKENNSKEKLQTRTTRQPPRQTSKDFLEVFDDVIEEEKHGK